MTRQLETTQLSDSDFLALVDSVRSQGKRLSYVVQTSERRAYLVALLNGSNDAELHVKQAEGPSAELLQAQAQATENLNRAIRAEQALSAAQPLIDKAQASADEVVQLRSDNSDLKDQLSQASVDLGNATISLRQENEQLKTKIATLTAQVAANQQAADALKNLVKASGS